MDTPLHELVQALTDRIVAAQDTTGCWNVLVPGDRHYHDLKHYVPNYKSTLWTLVFLADIGTDVVRNDFSRPLATITGQFHDAEAGIFSIGRSHFPIPCLNGNMLYLHGFFQSGRWDLIDAVVDFFAQYQRFDDGGFRTPSAFPYCSNRSCYGKHTCYWGVVKLLKGLSFLPRERRSPQAMRLIQDCIDFVLLHRVCYSSHRRQEFLQKGIERLTFPNMYRADFLEVLWLLKREGVVSARMDDALDLLEGKRDENGRWRIERPNRDLAIPFGAANHADRFVTRRANEVLSYYRG